jgi:hypothetical protein
MHNYHAIETEAEFRRQEWQRAAAADMLASVAQAAPGRPRGPRLPRISLDRLRALASPRLPFTAPVAPPRKATAAANLGDC